jgi:riboflavin kinase/FMN adenylyltransferase
LGSISTWGGAGGGNPGLLSALARAEGVEVLVHPAVRVAGAPVSSSAVRVALATGEVEKAAGLLGRHYSLAGPVQTGAGRGRGLGFPTANVALPPGQAIPAPGVYLGSVLRSGEAVARLPVGGGLPAMANIGRAPTFAESGVAGPLRLEAHVLEGGPPSYGEVVRVFFQRRRRPERRFAGRDDLVAQLQRDQAAARAYFGLAPGRPGPAET